jgi:prolyl 4-hydroxylase
MSADSIEAMERGASSNDPEAQFQLGRLHDDRGDHARAVAWLERAASAGHFGAMSMLGLRLVAGRGGPRAPERGVALLRAALEKGDPDAAASLAVLACLGNGVPRNWDAALDYLQLAAELGSHRAQGQLVVLAQDVTNPDRSGGRGPAEPQTWAQLRRDVDLAPWSRPCSPRVLSAAPRLVVLEGFIGGSVCEWLVECAAGRVAPAQIYDSHTGKGQVGGTRKNSSLELNLLNVDIVAVLLRARIAAIAGSPVAALEPAQILHYAVGKSFDRHFDFLDTRVPAYAQDVALRGQRVATFLVYLNDAYEGGQTEFPMLGLRHRGQIGSALLFSNVDPSGAPDQRTLHAGLAPTSGEKWAFSQWIRDRARAPASSA